MRYLFIIPAISRMNIVWASGLFPYARKKGLGGAVIKHTGIREIIIATAVAALLTAVFVRTVSFMVIPVSILFGLIFMRYVNKKIGGITGDTIGAVIELTEVVTLLTLLLFGSISL
jgi:adenosylcobinamide-GDP ribazoletransferase